MNSFIGSLPRIDTAGLRELLTLADPVTNDVEVVLDGLQDPLLGADRTYFASLARNFEDMGQPEMAEQLRRLGMNGFPENYEPFMPDIRLHSGDLVIDRLDVECDLLIVDGNVMVRGALVSNHSHDAGAIVALGHVKTQSAIVLGGLIVRGNLDAEHVYANSLNDCALIVGGNAQMQSLAEFGSYVEIHGDLTCAVAISTHNKIKVHGKTNIGNFQNRVQAEPYRFRGLLKEELITTQSIADGATTYSETDNVAYDTIDEEAYRTLLGAGRSPLLNGL